jgi:arylsulfatase A-like enzyme
MAIEATRRARRMLATRTQVRARSARALVLALACVSFAGCHRAASHGPARRVILITCDTLRPDRLGTYGYALRTSPNVDAFARENVVFDTAYSTAPWTGPALCALHTGKLPDEIGVPGGNRFPLPPQSVTLAELARDAGYATAAVVSNWVLRRPDPKLGDAGFPQGFETFDDEMTVKEPNRDLYERVAPDTTAAAVRWLDAAKRAGNDRFFLWVHFQDPHGPYRAPPEYAKRFERSMTNEPSVPIGKTVKGKGQIPSYQAQGDETRPEAYRMRYDAEIAYFDESFGALLAAIRRLEWLDDALIVFTADHGESLGEHGYWFCHGENLYNEEVRVPLVIHFPRGATHVAGVRGEAGERVSALVGHLDLWPTVLEALGLASSENRGASLFRPLPEHRVGVQTFGRAGFPNRWEAVCDGRYRLVMAPGSAPQLFDLAGDGGERADRAGQEPQRVAELAQRMQQYFENHKSAPLQPIDVRLDERGRRALKGLGYTDGDDRDEH